MHLNKLSNGFHIDLYNIKFVLAGLDLRKPDANRKFNVDKLKSNFHTHTPINNYSVCVCV